MSYNGAKACFTENINSIPNPMSDAQTYNLNKGLLLLTKQLQADIAKLEHALALLPRR
jgi:hypothetical protein